MFKRLFVLANRRLWVRVLVPVSLSVMLVVAATLGYTISFQNRLGTDQVTRQNRVMLQAVAGGMFDALARGDNDTVRNQLLKLNQNIPDLRVWVYDEEGIISFGTQVNAQGKSIRKDMGEGAGKAIVSMLETGKVLDSAFPLTLEGKNYIMESIPFLNEARCVQCHGQEKKVLGGLSVLTGLSDMQKIIQKGTRASVLIGVAGTLSIILFVWMFFYFLVNKKVRRVIDATAQLREKDFTRDREVKPGDELNHILARINLVIRELRQTIQQIVDHFGAIFSSATGLSQIADSLDASSLKASEMSASVSAAAEQMNAGNQSMAAAMEVATQTLTMIAGSVDEMSQTVGEISKNAAGSKMVILQVVEAFDSILLAVEELGTRANDVDGVTDEIRSISEQVSMLALNAKIEAARAGHAGKGFAVVAQEITELAAITNQSTLEADKKLRWIKTTAKQLIEKVSSLSTLVKDSDDAMSSIAASVEEQKLSTREIAKNINGVSDKITLVNQSVSQGVHVAAEMAQDIIKVQEVSDQVRAASTHLNESASALTRMAETFMALMKQFKV